MKFADIGVIGLAVMGENLVLNMEDKGFRICVYNRSVNKVIEFLNGRAKNKNIIGASSLEEFVSQLARPRIIMMMVRAGSAVDLLIEQLIPLLSSGDILMDGGNTHYLDTERRQELVEMRGMHFVGVGVSGGEEGALKGPSIMPGGSASAWPIIKPILTKIAATVDNKPCCIWLGSGGAGHFVKMVHNGIEYGDMQIICEIYHLMRDALKLSNQEMAGLFRQWNDGKLNSYLIEITGEILSHRDEEGFVVDRILDRAGQKGTGKWTTIAAMEENVELTLIAEAVFARMLSTRLSERLVASDLLKRENIFVGEQVLTLKNSLEDAMYLAKIVSYTQGFSLLFEASKHFNWDLSLSEIALIWRGGCIIRSTFLNDISAAYENREQQQNLLLTPMFSKVAKSSEEALRTVVKFAIDHAIPMPATSAALAYLDGIRTVRLPVNLLQAQRDYFGAHMYERVDRPRGEFFHTNWTGEGGTTTSSQYSK